jgi:threonyl-tRNA synthetase
MGKVISQDLPFIYAEYTREEISVMNQLEPLKLEVISGIPEHEVISTYSHGEFEDLCAGPHVLEYRISPLV